MEREDETATTMTASNESESANDPGGAPPARAIEAHSDGEALQQFEI